MLPPPERAVWRSFGGVKPRGALRCLTSMAVVDPASRSGSWISVRPRSMRPETVPLPRIGPLIGQVGGEQRIDHRAVGIAAVRYLDGEVGRQAGAVDGERAGNGDVAALGEPAGKAGWWSPAARRN